VLFDGHAGFTASNMETLLLTEHGIEVLSKLAPQANGACWITAQHPASWPGTDDFRAGAASTN
jgi:hypothetical protein